MAPPGEARPLAFISYRRQDSSAAARWLYDTLRSNFGPSSVFMDVESIRASNDWQSLINDSLAKATVVLATIGPNWLRVTDEYFRRRIDRSDDWVQIELAHALALGKPILPVLLSGTRLPTEQALPPALAGLTKHQAFELRDERWEQDLAALVQDLERLRFRRQGERPVTRLPRPRVTLAELTPPDMLAALEQLPGWEVVTSRLPDSSLERLELFKRFEFNSFKAAMAFMTAAAAPIAALQHHPRWENVWRTVTVWLTTWDIGHRPSTLDVELAKRLEAIATDGKRGARRDAEPA